MFEGSSSANKEPYVFVSYSHADTVKVMSVLRILDRYGIRFWYDDGSDGIRASRDWNKYIHDQFDHSSMFLCFLSNGVEQRQVVLEEIQLAIERYEKEEEDQVLFIFLEKMPTKVFSDNGFARIEEFINRMQHIRYEGITDNFLQKLFAGDVFPDKLVKKEFLQSWLSRSEKDYKLAVEEAFTENPYICETIFPEKQENDSFYKVRLNQIAPDAVCLICLDNQWVPPTFFDDPEYWKKGFLSEKIREKQTAYQKKEILRALLHNRQLITNRAFFYNSGVLGEWYDPEDEDYEAFKKLLANGSMLVFLTDEEKPYDKNHPPRFSTRFYEIWGAICREQAVYCLRMDWTDRETNRMKTEQLLFSRFQNFCLTMGENKNLMEDLASAFHFAPRQKKDFIQTWEQVQMHAAARDRDEKRIYTREQFYRKFLVRKGTDVSDGILDIDKPFAPELKEIIDFQYGLNLPDALGARALYPTVGHLKEFYRSTDRLRSNTREIAIDELTCAIGQFVPDFIKGKVFFPNDSNLQLADVQQMRNLPEWKRYIRAIENGNHRAHLQEVDFYDISFVWERYYEWLEAVRQQADTVLWKSAGKEENVHGRKPQQ